MRIVRWTLYVEKNVPDDTWLLLAVFLLAAVLEVIQGFKGTEGRFDAPYCALLPVKNGEPEPVGGHMFSLKRLLLSAPLGNTKEGALFEYRRAPGDPGPFDLEDWYFPEATSVAYQPHVKDKSRVG